MNDQERITDFIASECVNMALRNDFLNILNQSHQTQSDLFRIAQSKGWYQVEQAPQSKVGQAYTRFSNQQPTA